MAQMASQAVSCNHSCKRLETIADPGQAASLSQANTERHTLHIYSAANLKSAINLTCMCLDGALWKNPT